MKFLKWLENPVNAVLTIYAALILFHLLVVVVL